MAYMQKYPSSIRLGDHLGTAAAIAPDALGSVLKPVPAIEDPFAWPPPSALAEAPGACPI